MKKLLFILVILFSSYGVISVKQNNAVLHQHVWTKLDNKMYAKDKMYAWADKEYICLLKLWDMESRWDHNAYNSQKVMGKNAGGIPQLLGMSPTTPPTTQIDRGLEYIKYRYTTACNALKFHKKHGWY